MTAKVSPTPSWRNDHSPCALRVWPQERPRRVPWGPQPSTPLIPLTLYLWPAHHPSRPTHLGIAASLPPAALHHVGGCVIIQVLWLGHGARGVGGV